MIKKTLRLLAKTVKGFFILNKKILIGYKKILSGDTDGIKNNLITYRSLTRRLARRNKNEWLRFAFALTVAIVFIEIILMVGFLSYDLGVSVAAGSLADANLFEISLVCLLALPLAYLVQPVAVEDIFTGRNKSKWWRFVVLFWAAAVGVFITTLFTNIPVLLEGIKTFQILLMGLPVAIVLWVYRTIDTTESLFFNSFSRGISLIQNINDVHAIGTGVSLLVKLSEQQTSIYDDDIKEAFRSLLRVPYDWDVNQPRREYPKRIFKWFKNKKNLSGLDLSKSCLIGANLQDVDLRGVNLKEAQLQGARLWEAQLQGVDLWRARLQGANLLSAQLHGANLKEAQAQGAILHGAWLQGADLEEVQLQGGILWKAQLQGANLEGSWLQGASLMGTQLQGVNLSGAQLQGADLGDVQLQGAYSDYATHLDIKEQFEKGGQIPFGTAICQRIDKGAELDEIIVEGGFSEDGIERMEREFDLDAGYWEQRENNKLKELLVHLREYHIGEAKHWGDENMPKRAVRLALEKYAKDDANRWIDEYNQAMGWDERHPSRIPHCE